MNKFYIDEKGYSQRTQPLSAKAESPNDLPEVGNKLLTLECSIESLEQEFSVLAERIAPVLDRTEKNEVLSAGRITAAPKSEVGERLENCIARIFSLDARMSRLIEKLAL